MDKKSPILIVGHGDLIETGLLHRLNKDGYKEVYATCELGLDPAIQPSVYDFFQNKRPAYVFLGSTRSGGIKANQERGAEFLYHNLESQNNIFYASWKFGVKKMLYIGSSCVYPKESPQPIKEESLLTGPLEKTSEPYAVAKIAGINLCQAFRHQYDFHAIAAVPATVYGPGSDTNPETAHVLGALLGRFREAMKENSGNIEVWGTGKARREFLYIDDFLDACLVLMDRYDKGDVINIASGSDVSIKELAEMIAKTVGFKGDIKYDPSKPDGASQKLLDNKRITQLGWKPKVALEEGIQKTYQTIKDQ